MSADEKISVEAGQFADGNLLGAAQVHRLAARLIGLDERGNGGYHVVHMTETAHLLTGAEDGQRLPRQRLPDKPGDDHAVPPGLPRSHGVEEPGDHGPQAALPDVGVDQALIDGLRALRVPTELPEGQILLPNRG